MKKRSKGSPQNRRTRGVSRMNAGMNLIFSKQGMDDTQRNTLGIAYHVALSQIERGHGDETHFSTLACAMNIGIVLAESGAGAESIDAFKGAIQALVRMRDRADKTGRWGLDGDGIVDLRLAVSLHDSQLEICSRRMVMAARDEVHRRIEAGTVFKRNEEVEA
ncbi:hypothetical protein AB4Y36_10160 [Paraburkholderia sp. BR10936]|uniref:hypothetical protein n=1 Tax=Paraburkholderia sp. BR10936 TaxID=3236993 RepID=UPI0034D2C535